MYGRSLSLCTLPAVFVDERKEASPASSLLPWTAADDIIQQRRFWFFHATLVLPYHHYCCGKRELLGI
jgi:hypothetical protein